jgi:hypothetical protein
VQGARLGHRILAQCKKLLTTEPGRASLEEKFVPNWEMPFFRSFIDGDLWLAQLILSSTLQGAPIKLAWAGIFSFEAATPVQQPTRRGHRKEWPPDDYKQI